MGFAVTEWVWIGDSHFPHVKTDMPEEAARWVLAGHTVAVETTEQAAETLTLLGGTPEGVEYRISRVKSRMASGIPD